MASTSKAHENEEQTVTLVPEDFNESVIDPTDSLEEFASEMSSSLQERNAELTAKGSTINEIQKEIGENSLPSETVPPVENSKQKDVSI